MKRAMVMGVLLGGLATSGCVIREVRVGDDSNEGGAAGAANQERWGCLDEEPVEPTDEFVSLQLELTDASTRDPRTDASVRVCHPIDTSCSSPIISPVRVDVAGKVTMQVPSYLPFYFEVYGPKGPNVDDPDFVRMLVFFSPREIARGAAGREISVYDRNLMSTLTTLGGGSFNDETGLATLVALDCQGTPATQVVFGNRTAGLATGQTSQFYTVDSIPTTTVDRTDSSGGGGFTNLLPGRATFLAQVFVKEAQLSPLFDEAGAYAFVRAGWYTQVYISP